MEYDNELLENFAGAAQYEREPTTEELEEIEAEIAQDLILERQELEDFEGCSPFDDFAADFFEEYE